MACASYARATSFQRSSEDSSKVKSVDFSYSFYVMKETRVEILAREWKRKECKGLSSIFVSIPIQKIQKILSIFVICAIYKCLISLIRKTIV